jgi:hypothetical protein
LSCNSGLLVARCGMSDVDVAVQMICI